MKIFLALFLYTITSFAQAQSYMLLPIVSVYDGDTIKTDLAWRIPTPLNKVSVRIYGIDTPEMPAKSYVITGKLNRAKCDKEAVAALFVKARVIEIIGSNTKMRVSEYKWGKYGGRIIADVSVGGINIAETLLNEGLAVEYYGSGTKHDWCQ